MRRAEELLDALRDQFTKTNNLRFLVDVELLRAVAKHSRSDLAAAMTALQAAVDIARPHGLVRPFRDLRVELAQVAEKLPEESPDRSFFDTAIASPPARAVSRPIPGSDLDSPTNRELDVLKLLA